MTLAMLLLILAIIFVVLALFQRDRGLPLFGAAVLCLALAILLGPSAQVAL